jgi:hypothetical protein
MSLLDIATQARDGREHPPQPWPSVYVTFKCGHARVIQLPPERQVGTVEDMVEAARERWGERPCYQCRGAR